MSDITPALKPAPVRAFLWDVAADVVRRIGAVSMGAGMKCWKLAERAERRHRMAVGR